MPTVLGHEAGGIVESVGPAVLDLAAGDKVIMSLRPVCGRCYFCVRGHPSLCSGPGGLMASDAGLAAVPLHPHDWHGEWNYTINTQPNPAEA